MRQHRPLLIFSAIVLVLLSMSIVQAQGGRPACDQLIDAAMAAIEVNCGNMTENSACYAYDGVVEAVPFGIVDDFFMEPGDTEDLSLVEHIISSQADQAEGTWGISILSLEDTNEDAVYSAAMVLLGDAALYNEVNPDGTVEGEDGEYLPMQVFTLNLGADNNSCKEAISGLLLQLEEDEELTFNGNEADLSLVADICTNVIFRPSTPPHKDYTVLEVISGTVTIFSDTGFPITLTTGEQVDLPLDEDGLFLVPQTLQEYQDIVDTIDFMKNIELKKLERLQELPYPEVMTCPFALPDILIPSSGGGRPRAIVVPGVQPNN